MRSVHAARSTHGQRPRISPSGSAPLGTRDGGSFSGDVVFTRSPSCTPSLHGRYPFQRYYECSDCCRAALRADLAMNTVLSRQLSHRPHDPVPACLPQPYQQRPESAQLTCLVASLVRGLRRRLRHYLAGSPLARTESGSLAFRPTVPPPVASHPVSRRRSYLQLPLSMSTAGYDFHVLSSCM